MNLWFLEPALHGRYPAALRFAGDGDGDQKCDMEQARSAAGFPGINLYYRTIATAASAWARITDPKCAVSRDTFVRARQGPRTDLDWEVGRTRSMTL